MNRYGGAMTISSRPVLTPLALAFLAGCATTAPGTTPADAPTAAAQTVAVTMASGPSPQQAEAFFANLEPHCGQAFAGRIVADIPAPAGNDPFVGKPLVMHVRECGPDEIRIPFHVGDDRSRTWVLSRTPHGLRLKHDHRHADGTPDATTLYGGDTATAGTAERQEFPVDAESKAMFTREGRTVSNANTWAMEVHPGRSFVYELSRPGRLFRVEFDLTQPITPPPPPWGSKE